MRLKGGGSLEKGLQGRSEDEAWECSRNQMASCYQECFFHRAKKAKNKVGERTQSLWAENRYE